MSVNEYWRKAEESNPIPFLRTQFSRLVAGPTPLHYFPLIGVPSRIRTDVNWMKTNRPGPLDDRDIIWYHRLDSNQ